MRMAQENGVVLFAPLEDLFLVSTPFLGDAENDQDMASPSVML